MAQKVEIPAGAINGVNAVFTTSVPYEAGSLSVWLNGQQILGGYAETSPSTGVFTITDANCIPQTGAWGSDSITVDYDDGTDADAKVIDDLAVTVDDTPDLVNCTITEPDALACVVEDLNLILCDVETVDAIACSIIEPDAVACQVDGNDDLCVCV